MADLAEVWVLSAGGEGSQAAVQYLEPVGGNG